MFAHLIRHQQRDPSSRRVVITGLGIINPMGIGIDEVWDAFVKNKTGTKRVDAEVLIHKLGSPMPDKVYSKEFTEKHAMQTYNNYYYAIINYIMREALQMSGLIQGTERKLRTDVEPERIGLGMGSLIGHVVMTNDNPKGIADGGWQPFTPYGFISNIMKEYGMEGYQGSNANACSATLILVGDAYRLIKDGYQDIIVAGGLDTNVANPSHVAFDRVGAVAKTYDDPATAVRPFDQTRSGTCPGDGGAMMVVESLDSALARGANILCEITGYDTATYGGDLFKPSEKGIQKVITSTLFQAGWTPHDLDLINCHATATVLGDPLEVVALKKLLGTTPEAFKKGDLVTDIEKVDLDLVRKTHLNCLKGHQGHLVGAAGCSEIAVNIKGMVENLALGTANLHNPIDPDLNFIKHGQHVKKEMNRIIKVALGFGANNSCLALQKYRGL